MSPETNNNEHLSTFDVVESTNADSLSRMAKIWILLTPKVLKVIIIVLASAVIVSATVVVTIIVTHITTSMGKTPEVTSTLPPGTVTPTTQLPLTAPTTNASSTQPSSSPSATTSSATSATLSTTSAISTITSSTTPTQVCTYKDEFLCGSGECIPWKQLCDGLPHCKDSSDEGIDCVCGAEQWRCNSGQCVPSGARCDQVHDCLDSSDETMCPDCSGFQCDTGLCLWDGSHGRCNGVFDCPDLSDEMGCAPRAGTVLCQNSVRVPQAQWCDGLDHCGDNSDETDCIAACSQVQFACLDGGCIQRSWLCDGFIDCQNGTDESSCGSPCLPTEFMCDNYSCVEETAVCNGVWDCRTGEDELHCFSAEEGSSGVLWARFQGQDYAVCADLWSTDFAVQICADINQLPVLEWQEVSALPNFTRLVAFNTSTTTAQTTNLVIRNKCGSGKIINISCDEQECGERKVAFLQSFVAGGQIVSPGKWPWVVSLVHLGKAICGGTLLDNQWVLTAAHCILQAASEDFDLTATPFYFDIVLGSTHKLGQSATGTPYRVRVDRIVLHPNLTRTAYGVMDWDVALVRMSVPVKFTDYIQPLCLPHQTQGLPRTSLCYLAGWGLINYQQVMPPELLRDARMQVWSDARCARNVVSGESTVNTNSTLCAGFLFGRPAPCQGDSGGPLMCLSASGRWMLGGVMSRGTTPCGLYQPAMPANRFTRVASIVQWIRQQIKGV